METFRILWINWRDIRNPSAGGAELLTDEITKRLRRFGHEVTLLTSKYPGCDSEETRDGVRIVRKGSHLTLPLGAPKFFYDEGKKDTQYDVVLEGVNTIPFFTPMYLRRSRRLLLLYQLTGELFHKEFSSPLAHLFFSLERRLSVPWYLDKTDHVITLAGSTKKEILDLYPGINSGKISVIPPGADHDEFEPGQKSELPLILFLNRLVPYKQPEHLIAAMRNICSNIPEAKLLIVGTPTRDGHKYVENMRRLVATNHLNNNVEFLLTKPFSKDKIKMLQSAWVHVLPSLKEGFGLSVIEAAASGTPSIAYDVPGLRDTIVDGKTGMLVKSGDINSLSQCLSRLLADKGRIKSLGDEALKRSAHFKWDNTAREFERVIKKCI